MVARTMVPNTVADHFDITTQTISTSLRVLTHCEMVTLEHQGREIYYLLQIDKMKQLDTWLEQFRHIWENRFDQLDQLLLTIKKNR
jgi:predicted transcriptional regulator